MADPRQKYLKIQTGVVKRILKEKSMYEKEVKQVEDRIQKMKNEGKDEYDIRKMGEVLAESEMMVPETAKRLQTAFEDLRNKLNDAEQDLHETAEYKDGLKQLLEAEKMLEL